MASNDPLAKPLIHGNYLSDPLDVAILLEGIQIALSFANTTAMRKYNMTLSNTPIPACSQYPFRSNDYWICAMHQDTGPENHQAGSCKMGPASDRMAVVDPRLRVHGIRGLRVADTSIMPQVYSLLFRCIIELRNLRDNRMQFDRVEVLMLQLRSVGKGYVQQHRRACDYDRRKSSSVYQSRLGRRRNAMVRAP